MRQQHDGGRILLGIILIGLGGIFLLGTVLPSLLCGFWTLFIIVPGALMFIPVLSGNRNAAGLAVPASIITGTGLILLYQSTTGRWGTWAYAWTLYAVFLGIGLWMMGRIREEHSTQQAGRGLVIAGLTGFVVFGACFEVLAFSRGGSLMRFALPALLIILGVWMLLRATGFRTPTDFHLPSVEINISARPRITTPAEPAESAEPAEPPKTVKVKVAAGNATAPPSPVPKAPEITESTSEAEELARRLDADIEATSDLAQDITDRVEDMTAAQRDLADEDDSDIAPDEGADSR